MRKTICTKSLEGSPFSWIDIEQPTAEELTMLAQEFGLDHHVVKDCMEPDHLPKMEEGVHADFILLRQHLWPLKEEDDTIREISTKVAIFFNSDYLITVHRRPQPFLEVLYQQAFSATPKISSGEIITRILFKIAESFEVPLTAMSNELEELEDDIFIRQKKPMRVQEDLYYMKRRASKIRKLLYLTTQVARKHQPSERDQHLMNDVLDSLQKLEFETDQVHDNATNLLNTYLSIAAHRTNEIVRILTIFSVFFLPLTFIVGIYGMNFDYMPELRMRLGYPLALVGMALITLGIFAWFRKKNWI